jgi:recombinational DNA repair protein RecR
LFFLSQFQIFSFLNLRQCASCVNAQQEELDQCNINIDEPRQIRPRRTNELVLRETVIKVDFIKEFSVEFFVVDLVWIKKTKTR